MPHFTAEYIWTDGTKPDAHLRSKTRVIHQDPLGILIDELPWWSFDGSSTAQAEGGDSDCYLKPVRMLRSPFADKGADYLVYCEVCLDEKGTPHPSNNRSLLRAELDKCESDPWFGFEQEYTLMANGRPLGFLIDPLPTEQGAYYCSVGVERAIGRSVAEQHLKACLNVLIPICGINAEVMPGQWEFQIGPSAGQEVDAIESADFLWIARYILERIAEEQGLAVSYDPKPAAGDWNGAGLHTNFPRRRYARRPRAAPR